MRIGLCRRKLRRDRERANGPIDLTRARETDPEVNVGLHAIMLQRDRAHVLVNGFFKVSHMTQCHAQAVVRFG